MLLNGELSGEIGGGTSPSAWPWKSVQTRHKSQNNTLPTGSSSCGPISARDLTSEKKYLRSIDANSKNLVFGYGRSCSRSHNSSTFLSAIRFEFFLLTISR